MRQQTPITRTLIIGASPLASELIDQLGRHAEYELVGVLAETSDSAQFGQGFPILGAVSDFDSIVASVRPDLIVVAPADRRGSVPVRRLLELRVEGRTRVEDGATLYERLTGAVEVSSLTPTGILFHQDFRPSRWCLLSTRIVGWLISLAALIVTAPLCAVIAVAIKLDSRGPVIFVQDRMGAWGRPFRLFKFRSMRPAEGQTSAWVRDNDERITRFGVWLRKFRLDELPQLVNILKGDMNLVGPRPHPVRNSEILTVLSRNLCDVSGVDIPYYSVRCLVPPGITGWAQVRYGYANDFSEELEKLRYDLYYVKHVSLGMDLRILAETVRVVLRGRDSSVLSHALFPARSRSIVPWPLTRKLAEVKTA